MTGSMLGDKIEDFGVGGSILHEMQNDEVHKNVHIKTTDGSIVRAHSVVLAAVSPKFKAVFEERAFGIYNLSTENVSASTWKMLLDFLYTGLLQLPTSQAELDSLLSACEALDFIPLLSHLKGSEFETAEFVCNICNVEFATATALKSHRGHHKRHNHEEYMCDVCLVNCRNEKTLARHKRMHHSQRVKEETDDFEDLESIRSFRKGEDDEEFQCDVCGHSAISLKALAAHKGHHTRLKQAGGTPSPSPAPNTGDYACEQCDRVFSSQSALNAHKRVHNNQQMTESPSPSISGELACEICNLTFATAKSLHAHRGHHFRKENDKEKEVKKPPASPDSNGLFACHKCDQTFYSRASLQSHLAYHRRTGPTCSICNQKCLNNIYLQRHMQRSHKGAVFPEKKLKAVKRKIVKRKYGILQKKQIKRLITKGKQTGGLSSNRDYLCPICSQKFEVPSYLRAHLQQEHANYKNWRDLAVKKGFKKSQLPPFWGDYMDKLCKDCDVAFDSAVHFVSHRVDKHRDPHPYRCNKCPEEYTSRVGIRGHVIRVHAPQWRLFHCPLCSYVTDIVAKARQHHDKKHPGAEMPTVLQGCDR